MNDQIRWVVQLSLGVMFALSVASKLRDPMGFARGVEEYNIVPRRVASGFAFLVIVCEAFLSVSYLGGWLIVFSVPLGLTLLTGFFAAVSVNLLRQRELPCYCFGSDEGERISARSLARLAMAISGELVLVLEAGFFSSPFTQSARQASPRDIALAVSWSILTLVAAVWALNLPDLLALAVRIFRKRRPNLSPWSGAGGVS
jgi:hypothetical protein